MNLPYFTTSQAAMLYECGYACDNAIFARFSKSEACFITDSRYTLEASNAIKDKNIGVVDAKQDLFKAFIGLCDGLDSNIVCDPNEINIADFKKISALNLKFEHNFCQQKRAIKTLQEIKLIKKSQNLNRAAFKKFAKYLGNLASKTKVKNEIFLNFKARKYLSFKGKFDCSFEPITAINANAAKPHALPTKMKLNKNDLILFDAGIKYKNYCSDMTRTAQFSEDINFNKKQFFKNKKKQKIYDIVLKAQECAINNAKSGMKASDLHKIAFDVINKAGFGAHFTHSLGHGVGLDIHELPRISPNSKDIICDGMVFTIEPGIYLNGEFGVRIEDIIVMENGRARIL